MSLNESMINLLTNYTAINNYYLLDIAPFNIKMIKSALLEFKNIYVYK